MMARYILPWFGGSATTWTVCMLFFQLNLLLGYFYAHVFTRPFKPRTQTILHVVLILAALIVLPITPTDNLKPLDADSPTAKILILLTLCVGLPLSRAVDNHAPDPELARISRKLDAVAGCLRCRISDPSSASSVIRSSSISICRRTARRNGGRSLSASTPR